MKHWQIYACFALTGFLLSGCWIQEAPVQKEKALFIVADFLTKEDSAVINQFSFDYKVKVIIAILTPAAIVERCKQRRYNADIDIILTENATLREQLQVLGAFKPVKDADLFSKLDRQFNNKHHLWLPVSHDPLIVSMAKDTSGNCPVIDFGSWHRRDSLHPVVKIRSHLPEYAALVKKSHRLNWLELTNSAKAASSERIYALSQFVTLENAQDSTYSRPANACRSYLVDNKRFITRIHTISVYAHGRNHATAQKFVHVFFGNAYSIASGRNQLPANKRAQANWYIRSLSIR